MSPFATARRGMVLDTAFLRTLPTNSIFFFFARFMTIREKQILTRATEIQKENGGNHPFFIDN